MRRYEEYTIQFDEIPARRTKWNVIYEMLDSLSLAVLLVMVLFAFVLPPILGKRRLNGANALDRNWVAVTTLGFHAQRGDIVVISQPNALNEPLIKRIIAVAGDTVEIDPQAHTVAGKRRKFGRAFIQRAGGEGRGSYLSSPSAGRLCFRDGG